VNAFSIVAAILENESVDRDKVGLPECRLKKLCDIVSP